MRERKESLRIADPGAMPMLSGGSVAEAELRFATISHRHNSGWRPSVLLPILGKTDQKSVASCTRSSARRIGISERLYKSVQYCRYKGRGSYVRLRTYSRDASKA
jgi:hypothetical protein